MTPIADEAINEVDFCAKIASASAPIFEQLGERCPFAEVRVEGLGSTAGKMKRKDLRFYDSEKKLVLTGEVKLPGGISAFNTDLIQDAQQKADHAKVQFFFTWDVNQFVLWDRYRQDKPLLDRRIGVWPLRLGLASPQEVARPEILDHIVRKFLPDLISDLSDILTGRRTNWALPPDEIFLRSLESHLDWPVSRLREYLCENSENSKSFDESLQSWMTAQGRQFLRTQPTEWRIAVDNAARMLAYVWTNRFIFYKALRARFPQLSRLELGPNIKTAEQSLARLDHLFQKAVEKSGDYETLLFPAKHDWANDLVFAPEGAVDAWRGFLRGIEAIDFRDVPADVVGLIFQKLISPEERYRLGQHFTGSDPVDFINSFCIRKAEATVLDPACGSGSFLVRAYYRKKAMNARRAHSILLDELYGADIALYPAHLATLNLAAREINDEANYPRIARADFFDIVPGQKFCELPIGESRALVPIELPMLDAIVANPPYVRQEKVTPQEKAKCASRVAEAFPGARLTGRADLHCYFWPHAARYLKEGGYFGFLTSGQWLDVDYGFALQRWILSNFKIVGIFESATERWFPDARVKTCIAILRRCSDPREREENIVRFVRFEKPLSELIGKSATGGVGKEADAEERVRQRAVDALRNEIESLDKPVHNARWRILLKNQAKLWNEGVVAGSILRSTPIEDASDEADESQGETTPVAESMQSGDYLAGKWGRYLRAPDLYFEIMDRFQNRFVPLGAIAAIRRGITSGCDAFFMPRDVTAEWLKKDIDEKTFRDLVGAPRNDVVSGRLRIIKDGAGTLFPIEAEFLRPEIHSLMKVDRPVIRARDLDRVVLLVGDPPSDLRGTYVQKYLRHGETTVYASNKSKAVPVPQRSSCASREPWYDLTKLVRPGFALWPMAQQYRHVIPGNPERLVCNHNLFDLSSHELAKDDQRLLVAILNCTLVGLFKTFYGRFAGTEGNLKTEVVDVNLIEIPEPRGVPAGIARRLKHALRSMEQRDTGRLVEEALVNCHSYDRAMAISLGELVLPEELRQADRRELDDAVFELLGVESAAERFRLTDRLYEETAMHFRAIRVTEIQKMEDRAKGGRRQFSPSELAADAWDALDLPDIVPLADWLRNQSSGEVQEFIIPDSRPVSYRPETIFDKDTVYFGKSRREHVVAPSTAAAALLARVAALGLTGPQVLPVSEREAQRLLSLLDNRHSEALARMQELVENRTPGEELREEVLKVLERWFVFGTPARLLSTG
jgi:type I restriction-modification system DNA methylase subunit